MGMVKRYIPEKVFNKIEELGYKHKQHLWIITDMIYRVNVFRKQDYTKNEFIEIPRYYFRDIVNDYKTHIDFLIKNNIIECDNYYSLERGKSLGYRFNREMISKVMSVEITKKTLSENIIKRRNERNNYVCDSLRTYKDYFLETFDIDEFEAFSYLEGWYNMEQKAATKTDDYINLLHKYNLLYLSLKTINDRELFFLKNDTNGRVDTNLTSLKGDYKRFIKQKNLYQIDIINSQPFFLSLYLTTPNVAGFLNKEELGKYIEWTSRGLFYEMFSYEYEKNYNIKLDRKKIKEVMFCIFYSKNGNFKQQKQIFSSIFPTIMNFIERKKEGNHREFAIKLQQIESRFCIDILCKELDKRDIKYYTIHDSWLVDKVRSKEVYDLVKLKFKELYGLSPELKIEKIN